MNSVFKDIEEINIIKFPDCLTQLLSPLIFEGTFSVKIYMNFLRPYVHIVT